MVINLAKEQTQMKFFKNTERALKGELENIVKNSMGLDLFIELYNIDNSNNIIPLSEIDRFLEDNLYDTEFNFNVLLNNIECLKQHKKVLSEIYGDFKFENFSDDTYLFVNCNSIQGMFFEYQYNHLNDYDDSAKTENEFLYNAMQEFMENIFKNYNKYLTYLLSYNSKENKVNDTSFSLEKLLSCYKELLELEK